MTHILLIDDEAAVLAGNCAALEAAGYRVSTAATGPEGLAAAAKLAPDAIVVEGALDDAEGTQGDFALCRALAARFPHLPLLVLTRGDEHLDARTRARQDRDGGWLPAQLFLEKPVSPSLIADEVAALLGGGH